MSIEIDIPNNIVARTIPTQLMEVVIEQVLKEAIPDEDFSVRVHLDGYKKLTIDWMGVN